LIDLLLWLLADRTVTQNDRLLASHCRLSIALSICLCNVVPRFSVGGWKLYHHVPVTAHPIHFFRHFCYRVYHLATKHSKKT